MNSRGHTFIQVWFHAFDFFLTKTLSSPLFVIADLSQTNAEKVQGGCSRNQLVCWSRTSCCTRGACIGIIFFFFLSTRIDTETDTEMSNHNLKLHIKQSGSSRSILFSSIYISRCRVLLEMNSSCLVLYLRWSLNSIFNHEHSIIECAH